MMRELGLFAGIGSFSLGLERSGLSKPVGFVEIDPFCQQILRKQWPNIPCYDNVLTREFVEGEADIITAGFPCQDISSAGKRAGLAGERSGLYREVVRAIRVVRPALTLLENVADILARGMGRVLGDMAEDGLHVSWDCISAGNIGAPHNRDRVWIVISDPHGKWQLQPPRIIGEIRRWVDNATRSRNWWSSDWQTQFETFRRMDVWSADGLDRGAEASAIKALGNSLTPKIPEIIGRAILASHALQGEAA